MLVESGSVLLLVPSEDGMAEGESKFWLCRSMADVLVNPTVTRDGDGY